MNKAIVLQGVDVTTSGVLMGEQTTINTDSVAEGSKAAAPQRDLCAAFNEWSAAKRFCVSEQPAAGR